MAAQSLQALKEQLQTLAGELGFALCRVAPCPAPPHKAEFLHWLEQGCHGEMGWLDRNKERRTDPQLVQPGAERVIVLAMNYWQGDAPRDDGEEEGRGKIARYAWNDDYHDFIGPKLEEIDRFLAEHGGQQRYYVDTGPVLERDYAALAGIGWHGKSTMLIHPKLGAWFLLCELMTTLPLPVDEPLPDRCGSCTRCLDACPTGALTGPHRLDARLCVSYLTIELKGSIPEPLRPLIGDRIYGCDDCAAACPWNRFATASQEATFAARAAVEMTLQEYLAMDDEAFRTLFRRSPIKRVKRRGFLRNVCVALGNTGTLDDLPGLERAAADPEPLIAEHARWAIEQIRAREQQRAARSSTIEKQPQAHPPETRDGAPQTPASRDTPEPESGR